MDFRDKKIYLIGGGVAAAFFVMMLGWYVWQAISTPRYLQPAPFVLPEQPSYYSYFSGESVSSTAEQMPHVIGIMIDNLAAARPQVGLSKAHVVYEVPVEGGITRYFALFNSSTTVDKVGPVRSARAYFLDWLQEYGDAVYVHVGGSPEALQMLRNSTIFDVNEFYRGPYFWRDKNRIAPHNVFTGSESWNKLIAVYGKDRMLEKWEGWKFATSSEAMNFSSSTPAQGVAIPYSTSYKIEWQYRENQKTYERLLNGELYRDESSIISANNIVVQSVGIETVDDEGRKKIITVGEGEALVLTRGKLIRGTWKKEGIKNRTRWYDQSGQEIPLTPGITWVEVVPQTIQVQISN
jgi:hypothetical protein